MTKQRILVVGATSAIAQHCLRRWLARPAVVLLVGRDHSRLERVASDLRARSPDSHIEVATLDFLDPAAIDAMVQDYNGQGAPDLALIAHGSLPDQLQCQRKLPDCRQALELNGVSPVLFMEALLSSMEQRGSGRLVIIGSVAGDRGRKSNYLYGAAKGMVERVAQGMQHRLALAGSAVTVTLVKPGPTFTPMTAHLLDDGMKLADVSAVAGTIVKGVERRRPVVYAPGKWRLIMLVIRHLPRILFKRLDI